MKILKHPVIAVLLTILIVFCSTAVSISVKLNNKCESIIDGFYDDKPGATSIYSDLCSIHELAGEVMLVAQNYGVDTRELAESIAELKSEIGYRNEDIGDIYSDYTWFYSSLRAVEIELSGIVLSQRHMEYMTAASEQIAQLKTSIDNSDYNDSVRNFYKKFDRFPVNAFADIFDVEYPEYFA